MFSISFLRNLACAALALAALGGASVSHADVLARIQSGGPLVLAHRESSVPFSYVVPGRAEPMGYAVDLCLKVAEAVRKHTGKAAMPVQWVQVTPANRIDMVASGKVDMECGSTTNNAERRRRVSFSIPHAIVGARLLMRADAKTEALRDMRDKVIVSTRVTTPLKVLQQQNREYGLSLRIVEAPDHAEAVRMVESGEAEAFVMDDVLLVGLIASRPKPEALKVVGRMVTTEPLAIMLPKDDPAFNAVVDTEMKRLITSGEILAIYDRWFMKPIQPLGRALNLPLNYLTKDFWKYPTDRVPF